MTLITDELVEAVAKEANVMKEPQAKSIDGYKYAVMSHEFTKDGTRAEKTWLIPMGMTVREALKHVFGNPEEFPSGRVLITVPETLPFTPSHPSPATKAETP